MVSAVATRPASASWPRWPLLVILTILLLGPPVAALFIATGLPILRDLGWLARDLLSQYICPTPVKSYSLFGAPMAVCARCWGATIGLWVGYGLFYQSRKQLSVEYKQHSWASASVSIARFVAMPWFIRFMLGTLPFLLWVGEISYWPGAPYWLLLLIGIQAGVGAGVFFCSIWPCLSFQE